MAIIDQEINESYAIYNGDSKEVMQTLPSECVGFSIYSPPFATATGGLYNYSSDPRDLSNSRSYKEFFDHYEFIVSEIHRLTQPGRQTSVHCIDIPFSVNAGSGLTDFPGDIIRLHEKLGFIYQSRRTIWKEPLGVRLRTMAKGLAHAQIIADSTLTDCAGADFLLSFRKKGENKNPVSHPTGLHYYAGSRPMPLENQSYKGWDGDHKKNKFSHWIWRQYASSVWDDIRGNDGVKHENPSIREKGVLPYEESKEEDDERHVHPLQLDVIERAVILGSNPGDVVLTPFMGVGSEAYIPVSLGRKAIGIELKTSYFKQAQKNMKMAGKELREGELNLQ